jgi:probable phosphoglycerate mutase
MTTFFLVRHCAIPAHGRYLAGRAPHEHLSDEGRAQRERLRACFTGVSLDAVYSSPLERAQETAAALAASATAGVQLADPALEVDCGEWTGKSFDELSREPLWTRFNTDRVTTRIPGGEAMPEVQARIVAFIDRIATDLPGGRVAIVSHGDVLRSAICSYIGLSLANMQRIEVSPGSVSVLDYSPGWIVLRAMNVINPTAASLHLV